MLTLQEISDRLEIQELLVRYAHAVDTRDWDGFRSVFTKDAAIDYTAFGGPSGGVEEVVGFLEQAMPLFSSTQHLVANFLVELDGDRAEARTTCHNPMAFEETSEVMVCGLWYRDALVRTADGWRIASRAEDRSYQVVLGG